MLGNVLGSNATASLAAASSASQTASTARTSPVSLPASTSVLTLILGVLLPILIVAGTVSIVLFVLQRRERARQAFLEEELKSWETDLERALKAGHPTVVLRKEIYRLEGAVSEERNEAKRQWRLWSRINFGIGLPAAAFAAGSGGLTGITKDDNFRVLAVLLALIAAFAAAIATSLNAAKRAEQARTTAARLEALRQEARTIWQIDLVKADGANEATYTAGRIALQVLLDRWSEIRGLTPSPPAFNRHLETGDRGGSDEARQRLV